MGRGFICGELPSGLVGAIPRIWGQQEFDWPPIHETHLPAAQGLERLGPTERASTGDSSIERYHIPDYVFDTPLCDKALRCFVTERGERFVAEPADRPFEVAANVASGTKHARGRANETLLARRA